ncbi:MAG: hypothetical protein JNL40_05215 [Cyclobacteriaceae bacterium]|nr:hypothetical protein [Cyclobacteriaceae bacterium]
MIKESNPDQPLALSIEVQLSRAEVLKRLVEKIKNYKPHWKEAFDFSRYDTYRFNLMTLEKDRIRIKVFSSSNRKPVFLYLEELSPGTTALRFEQEKYNPAFFLWAIGITLVIFFVAFDLLNLSGMTAKEIPGVILFQMVLIALGVLGYWFYFKVRARNGEKAFERRAKKLVEDLET